MAVSFSIPYLSEAVPASIQIIVLFAIVGVLYFVYSTFASERPWKGFPVVALTEDGLGPKDSWFMQGKKTITKGTETYSGPFQVITGTGPKIILPNRFAEEIKNKANLNFSQAILKDFFPNYPGFEALKQGLDHGPFIAEVIRVKLTQSLGLVTADLVEETTDSIHDIFGENAEWNTILLKQNLMHLVARLSSRVFLGKPLCRNPRWLEIAENFTIDAFLASRRLRGIPPIVRPIAHWFLPECIALRKNYRDAQKLISPEVELRKERAGKALEAGQKPPKTADIIGWIYEMRQGKAGEFDYAAAQLGLSMAAIHTTTEAMTQAIIDLCSHPEFVQPLRDEVVKVIGETGWSKTALYKLRLMDSFLKESQRLHPPSIQSMNRLVESDLELSDGTIIPKGARIVVAGAYFDTTVYAKPDTFDPYRFLREREKPEQYNSWQHVTTTGSHMGFGHGKHGCPGRFFASNEIKIAMSHLLLKYDWKQAESGEATIMELEAAALADPMCQVQMRRRKEEIDLDLIE